VSAGGAGEADLPGDETRIAAETAKLIVEIARLADDPQSDDEKILAKLEALAEMFTRDEIFAKIIDFDTPDFLG
jgi:hypothetical protein